MSEREHAIAEPHVVGLRTIEGGSYLEHVTTRELSDGRTQRLEKRVVDTDLQGRSIHETTRYHIPLATLIAQISDLDSPELVITGEVINNYGDPQVVVTGWRDMSPDEVATS